MIHEDLIKSIISVINGTHNHHKAATKYHVTNRKILKLSTALESIQEQRENTLVESYNQQQIFIWARNHLNLPSAQDHGYTEWDLLEACEIRIFDKSSYFEILENVGVPKFTIFHSLNVIFPSLKYSSLEHLWGLIVVGKTTKKIVSEVIVKMF